MFSPHESVRSAKRGDIDRSLAFSPTMIENKDGKGPILIVCDHASNAIPEELNNLGLGATELRRHIAWDPGAWELSRALSRRLDAALVGSAISRLVIDCNREPGVFDSIPVTSEDTNIPGNAALTQEARAWRERAIYEPFHAAIDNALHVRSERGAVAIVAVHTYTPVFKGRHRPWHVGILFDKDRRLADPVLAALRAAGDLVVGENEPYRPEDRVYHTLDRHAQSRGLASIMIEIRNDLVAT